MRLMQRITVYGRDGKVLKDKTMYYVLKRLDDNSILHAFKIAWIEWNEIGRTQASHDKIGVGYSLILDPHRFSYTWLTTVVTEIEEEREGYTRFKTKNSTYELTEVE